METHTNSVTTALKIWAVQLVVSRHWTADKTCKCATLSNHEYVNISLISIEITSKQTLFNLVCLLVYLFLRCECVQQWVCFRHSALDNHGMFSCSYLKRFVLNTFPVFWRRNVNCCLFGFLRETNIFLRAICLYFILRKGKSKV